jgi:hypothetical protein
MPDFPEFIRVRIKDSDTECTIAKPEAIDPEVYEVLKEPAVDDNGRALPPKFPEKSKNQSGQKAATEKES